MREAKYMREILADICERFPGKRVLNYTEAASYLGCDPRTAKKRFPFKGGIISVIALANELGVSQ